MAKVWLLVETIPYEGSEIIAAFASEVLADRALVQAKNTKRHGDHTGLYPRYLGIEEHELVTE